VELVVDVLLLLDFDVPEALGAFLLCGGGVVMAGVGIDLGDAEGEEGEGEEFEDFGCCGGGVDGGTSGFFLRSRLGVCWGLESAKGAFDWGNC